MLYVITNIIIIAVSFSIHALALKCPQSDPFLSFPYSLAHLSHHASRRRKAQIWFPADLQDCGGVLVCVHLHGVPQQGVAFQRERIHPCSHVRHVVPVHLHRIYLHCLVRSVLCLVGVCLVGVLVSKLTISVLFVVILLCAVGILESTREDKVAVLSLTRTPWFATISRQAWRLCLYLSCLSGTSLCFTATFSSCCCIVITYCFFDTTE